jgi:peptidyl-prolyl cis-trans isomerase SurA
VLIRRAPARALLAGAAVALAVGGLAGCRTSPTVAAYVGDSQISVDGLNSAVAAREASDPALAAYARQNAATFPRTVLGLLVTDRVYDTVEQRYGVRVEDQAVRDRITQLLQGSDEQQAYAQLAEQGISREDVFENVRQQLVRQAVARAKTGADPLSEQALRTAYERDKAQFAGKAFGYIDLPDQATANAVLQQLTADPGSYAAVAAQHPGQLTLPAMAVRTSAEVPQALQQGIAAAAPNTGFTVPGPSGDVVLCFVGQPGYVSFEDARTQLEQSAQSAADQTAQQVVGQVRQDLHVKVNPRYGVLKADGTLSGASGGVVDILGGAASASGSGGS